MQLHLSVFICWLLNTICPEWLYNIYDFTWEVAYLIPNTELPCKLLFVYGQGSNLSNI